MRLTYLYLIFIACFFSACSTTYGPARYGSPSSFLHKPVQLDSLHGQTFLHARGKYGNGYNDNDEIVEGELFIYRGHNSKYLNLAYGGYAFGGNYKLMQRLQEERQLPEEWLGNKGYYGWGLQLEAGFQLPLTPGLVWRIIQLGYTYQQENGTFSRFRRQLSGFPQNDLLVVYESSFHSLTYSTELVFARDTDKSLHVQFFTGKNSGEDARFYEKGGLDYLGFHFLFPIRKLSGQAGLAFSNKGPLALGLGLHIPLGRK